MDVLIQALFVGIFATLAIDLWTLALTKLFNLPTTNWAMVGRWVGHLKRGQLIHRPISASEAIPWERAMGWGLHYLVGIIYAAAYLFLVAGAATLPSATLFGIVTLLFPWLVLQPGLGLGCFARLAKQPNVVRAINVSVHTLFGASLFFGWLLHRYASAALEGA